MEFKSLVWIGVTVGSFLGSLLPLLWGAGGFSFSSIIFSALGAFLGIFVVYKLTH